MKKALVISVGTGTTDLESLVNGIGYSIKQHNPNETVFLVSSESEKIMNKIIDKIKFEKNEYSVVILDEIDNIDNVTKKSADIISDLIENKKYMTQDIVIDFTSGTKAMSAGLAIAAAIKEVGALSYVSGKRQNGIVIKGLEKLVILKPFNMLIENRISVINNLFRLNQFDSCIEILKELKEKTNSNEILSKLNEYEIICHGYSLWDKFEHQRAREILENIDTVLAKNKEFICILTSLKKNQHSYLIADLLNNAIRRIDEGKFDDSVARLYRTIEMLGQYKLLGYSIISSDVDINKIPEKLKERYQNKSCNSSKIKIGLCEIYELLNEMDDELGAMFLENKKLQNLLKGRNDSILAHGTTPINKEISLDLLKNVNEMVEFVIPTINELMEKAKFQGNLF